MRHKIEALINARRDQYLADRPSQEILIMADGETVHKGFPPRLCPHVIDLNIRSCPYDLTCLFIQWEPKVESLSKEHRNQIHGYEQEDLKQEFNIGVLKAVRSYIKEKAKFSTYMLRCCQNVWIDLYRKSKADDHFYKAKSLGVNYGAKMNELDIPATDDSFNQFEINDLMMRTGITEEQAKFITLRNEGYTMIEIKEKLGKDAYTIRYELQDRFNVSEAREELYRDRLDE